MSLWRTVKRGIGLPHLPNAFSLICPKRYA